jgi:hypothetical protein
MRGLARLVAVRTYVLTEEKRHEEALNSFRIGLKLGEALKDEPTFISQLVRIALNGIAMESLSPVVYTFPKEISINDYQKLILEIDKKEERITKGLEGELALYGSFAFEKLLKGDIKELLYEGVGFRDAFFFKIYASYPLKPILKQDYAFYVRCLTEAIRLSRQPYYQTKDRLLELEKKAEIFGSKYILGRMIIPSLNRSQINQTRDNAQLDGLKIACALKIYKKQNGYYPENLADLVPNILPELPLDEFTGEGFIYRKQGKGFIVYSLGPNEKDDDGISLKKNNERSGQKGYDKEAYDIEWKCEE